MNIDELKVYLDTTYKLFNTDNVVSVREATMRGGRFLESQYHISMATLQLSSQLFKLSSLQAIKYAQLMALDTTSKNAQAVKANIESNPEYIDITEKVSEMESTLEFLKAQSKLHENAHIFFRNQMKEFKGDN